LLSGRQVFGLAFVLDWVTLLGSSLRHQAAFFLLPFLRVPSDVVWLLVQGE
ncbi:hypothetical protein PanWU01x14_083940, partial [Parasponia andersonii]